MNKEDQIQFVSDLSNRVRDDIIEQINSGKVLQEWDGHELRSLLEYRHKLSADMSRKAMKGMRRRILNNHVIVANL